MSNPGSKEQFLKQFENIVEGIKTNKSKVINIENVIVSPTNWVKETILFKITCAWCILSNVHTLLNLNIPKYKSFKKDNSL